MYAHQHILIPNLSPFNILVFHHLLFNKEYREYTLTIIYIDITDVRNTSRTDSFVINKLTEVNALTLPNNTSVITPVPTEHHAEHSSFPDQM